MNKKWIYPKKSKVIMTILVICIGFLLGETIFLSERFSGNLRDTIAKYEDTYVFSEDMQWNAYKQLGQVRGKELFDENGVYAPKKLVNAIDIIKQIPYGYPEEGYLNMGEEPVYFYAEDLRKMQENGYGIIDVDTEKDESVIVCKKADGSYQYYLKKDFEEYLKKEKAIIYFDGSTIEVNTYPDFFEMIYSNYDPNNEEGINCVVVDQDKKLLFLDSWVYGSYMLANIPNPVGYTSILDFVNRNSAWNGRLSFLNSLLEESFRRIIDFGYGSQEDADETEETNLTYLYVNHNQRRVISSNPDWTDYDHFVDYLKEMTEHPEEPDRYKYFVYDYMGYSLDTNIKKIDVALWDNVLGNDMEIVAAAIDTAYPVEDDFKMDHDQYTKYSRVLIILIPLTIIGVVALLVLWVLLTLGAGRESEEDTEIHLNWFDRLKTEIGAIGITFVWAIILTIIVAVSEWVLDGAWTRVFTGIWFVAYGFIAAYSVFCFLIGYLSLVRRIKAKTLWSNSLTKIICSKCIRILRNISLAWKVIIVLLIGAYIQFEALFSYYRGIWVMLLLLLEMTIAAYLFFYVWGRMRLEKRLNDMVEGDAAGGSSEEMNTKWMLPEHVDEAARLDRISQGVTKAMNEKIQSERMKTELITNVSHDLKTPLTSIINYVDLCQKEEIDNPKVQEYLKVLESKSQRLKTLTEDIVEASRASSGNIKLNVTTLDFNEMIRQVEVEFEDRFADRNLQYMVKLPDEPALIAADGRYLWRIVANLFSNASKYAMPGSRIYAEVKKTDGENTAYTFSMKNTSEQELNISAEELTERFVRGDRSRLTEGSGLGLSIAKSLAELQGGSLTITIDGDLFRADLTMPMGTFLL